MSEQSPWRRVSSRQIHETPWLKVVEDEVITPTGKPGRYTYTIHPKFALMMVRNDKGKLLLIRQFRYPTGQIFWEFPAGGSDADESPEATAARELGEEAGLVATSWRRLGLIHEAINCSDHVG